jgi:integrase/recombinase XerC
MRRWDRLVDSYMESYRARGVGAATIGHVASRLDAWGRWLKQRRPKVAIEEIDAELITRYMASRTSFRAKSTVYGTLSSMRGFGDFLVKEGLWTTNPLRWMKGPKLTPYSRLPKRIDREHMEALWREAAHRRGEYSSHLWITVLAMLYGTGLRRGELARLDIQHFDPIEWTLRIDGRKTGRERCVPLPEMVMRCLEGYLPLRHNALERAGTVGERALLVTRRGERLTAESISNTIHHIARRAGVSFHSLHQFRHTCASDLLEAGVHIAEVQRILGHCGVATTVRYVHIADPQRREAMSLHPLNTWLQPQQREAA